MFLRIVKAQGGQGVQHEYVRLVEAYREHGKNKQRVVCNLGRKDLLAAHLDGLIRLLRGERAGAAPLRVGAVQATGAWDWGPVLVARTLWRELGVDASLAPPGGRGRAPGRAPAGGGPGAGGGRLGGRSRSGPWCSWPTGSAPRRVSTAWPAGWRRTSSAMGRGGGGSPRGATRRSARRARRPPHPPPT